MKWNLLGEQEKHSFKGAYSHDIKLTLYPRAPKEAGHVVILAFYEGQLLFTKHNERGYEWPGGKVEESEAPLSAAIRELEEETGGIATSMYLIGQYDVKEEDHTFIKNIYMAPVYKLENRLVTGIDTEGAVLFPIDIQPVMEHGFSPLVCDQVFQIVRNKVLFTNTKK